MKLKFFVGFILLVIVVTSSFLSERRFRIRNMKTAASSFEAGCLYQGLWDCTAHNPRNKDLDVQIRGKCLDELISQCTEKTKAFVDFLSQGAKK